MSNASFGLFILTLILTPALFCLSVLIMRWTFRINIIIGLLEKIANNKEKK